MPPRSLQTGKSKWGKAGYPEIESLIESEDFERINASFSKAYDELAEVARKKRGLKKGRDARKAMRSLELTMELFRELLSIKYQLEERMKQSAASKG